jgi:ribonuclease P protein component
MAKQFTLGKHERLKSRKAIEQLFSEGKKFTSIPFRVFYNLTLNPSAKEKDFEHSDSLNPASTTGHQVSNIRHPSSVIQFGVGVSSKNFKKAVERNRVKRLVREAWRLQKNLLQEKLKEKGLVLNVFCIYTNAELPDYQFVAGKMETVIKKLQKLIHENISPGT